MLFDEVTGLFDDAYGLFDDGAVKNDSGTVTGQTLTSSVGTIVVTGTAIVQISGVTATASTGSVVGSGDAIISVEPVQVTGQVGLTTANGQLDATATVSGVSATVSVGSVTATNKQTQITGAGSKKRKHSGYWLEQTPYKPQEEVINNKAILIGIQSKSFVTEAFAEGQVIIPAVASIGNVVSFADYKETNASGIINPSDEEIIYLMVA